MKSRYRKLGLLLWFMIFGSASGQDLQVRLNVDGGRWIARDQTLTLRLSRPLQPDDGKLAVFIGTADMTDLFVNLSDSLMYNPSILLLPSGETELSVSLVSKDNDWQEIARFPLRVKTGLGFTRAEVTPRVSLTNSGQVAEGHAPEENRPERSTYQDFTGQSSITTEHVRGNLEILSQWDLVGASEQNQALRFGERGDEAYQIDLSSYLLQVKSGQTTFSMGHIQHGGEKHLVSSFGGRGMKIQSAFGQRMDLSVAAMSASDIVGWDNFIGLNRSKNRIVSGALGVNLLSPSRGVLRIEGTVMDGRRLPLDNFNQGSVNDAEESRGVGFQVKANTRDQRVRFEGGFARSTFVNPRDPFLEQEEELVPVEETTRNARFANLSLGLLQNVTLGANWQVNVNLSLRHERVDPLYRSLAAFARSDYLENAMDVQSNLGVISLQFSHIRSEDNLDDISSILKTKTRVNSLNMSLPLAMIFTTPSGPSTWLPMLSYSYNRTHQFGDSLPVNSGFSEGHVPDQVSDSHNGSLDWSGTPWHFSYRVSYSQQDNRQVGREKADFSNFNHGFSFGLTPLGSMDVGFELSFERSENKELDRTDLTRRFGLNLNLRTTTYSSLTASFARTHSSDDVDASEQNSLFFNAQWSYRFTFRRAGGRDFLSGQAFVRYNRNEADSRDLIFGFASDSSSWTVNTGVNLSLF